MKMETNVKKNGRWPFWAPGVYETRAECPDGHLSSARVKRSFAHETALFVAVGKTDNRISWGERPHFFLLFVHAGLWQMEVNCTKTSPAFMKIFGTR